MLDFLHLMNSLVVIDTVIVVDLTHLLLIMDILSKMQWPCLSFTHVINSKVQPKLNYYFKNKILTSSIRRFCKNVRIY